jgi:hypothetical protein
VSLRSFHLFFIALSVVLAAFCAAWGAAEYRAGHGGADAIFAVVSAGAGAALIRYGTAFRRTTRQL